LSRVATVQSTVIAFDTAFNAVALLFVVAAPVLVTVKIGLHRYAKKRAARSPGTESGHATGHVTPAVARLETSSPACTDTVLPMKEIEYAE
jgi:DHA2 family multidrug resistance protein